MPPDYDNDNPYPPYPDRRYYPPSHHPSNPPNQDSIRYNHRREHPLNYNYSFNSEQRYHRQNHQIRDEKSLRGDYPYYEDNM